MIEKDYESTIHSLDQSFQSVRKKMLHRKKPRDYGLG